MGSGLNGVLLPEPRFLDFAPDGIVETGEFLKELSSRDCRGISPRALSRSGQTPR